MNQPSNSQSMEYNDAAEFIDIPAGIDCFGLLSVEGLSLTNNTSVNEYESGYSHHVIGKVSRDGVNQQGVINPIERRDSSVMNFCYVLSVS